MIISAGCRSRSGIGVNVRLYVVNRVRSPLEEGTRRRVALQGVGQDHFLFLFREPCFHIRIKGAGVCRRRKITSYG
jgi:hypothetical protein